MSTAKLRYVIEAHREGRTVSADAISEAERELEAIENAAKALVDDTRECADNELVQPAMLRYGEAMDVMERIASEAK